LHTDVVERAVRGAVIFRDEESGDTAKVIFHADSKYVRCQVFPGFVTLTPIDPRGYRGVGGVLAAS